MKRPLKQFLFLFSLNGNLPTARSIIGRLRDEAKDGAVLTRWLARLLKEVEAYAGRRRERERRRDRVLEVWQGIPGNSGQGCEMSPFTGPVFSRPDGLGGVTWHRRHHTYTAVSERITVTEAAIYFGGRTFARMAFARLRVPA